MPQFTRASLERLREAIDMVALVSERTELRRVGSRWMGLCPFHDERTPSFSVNAEDKLYHCFGCGASGDAIRFVEEIEGLDFVAAVEALAERFGVQLEREAVGAGEDAQTRRRQRLFELLARAAAFYARVLWESEDATEARRYLAARGLREEVLRSFRVGFAPPDWHRLARAAAAQGFSADELIAAGLCTRSQRGLYDRFRGRITFPICDRRGRVLGFGARRMGTGEGPKYLNSPESELFRKGRVLFGADRARAAAAKRGRVIVVEGYTDVLALHQVGLQETVAVMGTALGEEQFRELERLAPRIVLALDPDRAGLAAMERAGELAERLGLELRVAQLPAGKDPADVVQELGGEAVEQAISSATPLLEYQVSRVLADADLEDPHARDTALEETLRLIAGTDAGIHRQQQLVRRVADELDVPVEWLSARLREHVGADRRRRRAGAGDHATPDPALIISDPYAPEREFLVAALAAGEAGVSALRRAREELFASPLWRRVRRVLASDPQDPLPAAERDGEATARAVSELISKAHERGGADSGELEAQLMQLELRHVERQLPRALRERRLQEHAELVRRRQELLRQIDQTLGSSEP